MGMRSVRVGRMVHGWEIVFGGKRMNPGVPEVDVVDRRDMEEDDCKSSIPEVSSLRDVGPRRFLLPKGIGVLSRGFEHKSKARMQPAMRGSWSLP